MINESKHFPINSSSFLAGRMIETLGLSCSFLSNLSRYGVNLTEFIIDLIKNIHAMDTPIKIAVSE